MAIIPDNKDWTWVLRQPCPECGFDTRSFPREEIPVVLRANARSWLDVLAGPTVRQRPDPQTWSALEYGCHVRDVFRLYNQRLELMLTQDDPSYENWDQDATAVQERYGEQNPGEVAAQVVTAADAVADRFGTVSGGQWERPGRRSDGAVFTVETFGRYLVHDPVHHLHDVTRQSS